MDEKILSDEFIAKIDLALSEYEKTIGIAPSAQLEAPAAICMTLEELRKKTPNELSEIGFQIGQYGLYLRRELNKQKAWARWAKSKLEEVATSFIHDTPNEYSSYQRYQLAKYTPELCKKLNAFLRMVEMKIDRLDQVPEQIHIVSDCIKDLKFAALRKEKEFTNATE